MKLINVATPGKIHLLGEHAVVYGKPALLATINKYCHVQLIPSQTEDITIIAKNLQKTITTSSESIIIKTKDAQKKWQQFVEKNDLRVLKSITEQVMDYPIIAIGETLLYFKKKVPTGFTLSIDSEIPIGAGLGSSAALAISVITAIVAFLGYKIDKSTINDIAFLVEQKRHGLPSGADNSIVCFGGFLWFRKEAPNLKLIQSVPFALPQKLAQNFILIDTGRPAESTGEMVGHVHNLYKKTPEIIETFLHDQELLTKDLLSVTKGEKELIRILKNGESNLEKIGVVSDRTRSIIRTIEKAGGVAKISGAGGIKNGSGIIIAYHKEKTILETIASLQNLTYYTVHLGTEGVTVRKI